MGNEPTKLPNQPLVLVLAEFKFSEVLKIKEHIPDIQENIRKRYPNYKEFTQNAVEVTDVRINLKEKSEWHFSSINSKSKVIIDQNRLVFITSEYDRFPEFSDRCMKALSVLKEIVEPTLLKGVGLRYNDQIIASDFAEFKKCVNSQLLPHKSFTELGSEPLALSYRSEFVVKTNEGSLIIRSIFGKHPFVVMPDLQPNLAVKLDKEPQQETDTLLLDIDHVWKAREGTYFDLGVTKKLLESLHYTARSAFWNNATTDYAKEKLWKLKN